MPRNIRVVIVVVFALTLLVFATPMYCKAIPRFLRDVRKGCVRLTDVCALEKNIDNRMFFKEFLVTLGGLADRFLGKTFCNGIVKVKGTECLVFPSAETRLEVEDLSSRCIAYHHYLKAHNVPFLFILVPYKMDWRGDMLKGVPGIVGKTLYDDSGQFVQSLSAAGVDVVDLTKRYAETPEAVMENFYRTDHHWNGDASLRATKEIVTTVLERLGEPKDASRLLDDEQWNRHVIRDCWIGSQGRRVGPMFAGKDDFIYHTPRFETSFTFEIPVLELRCQGRYEETCLRTNRLERGARSLYGYNPYAVYGGGDYQVTLITNGRPRCKKRILLLKDSFGLPVMTQMATVFEKVVVIDPRGCANIAELSLREPYNMVIQLVDVGAMLPQKGWEERGAPTEKAFFDYGLERLNSAYGR